MKLEIKNAVFGYNSKLVFDSISLNVESGDMLCLLGPNGTGKTTLFKSILGFLKLKDGEIYLNNEDISCWNRKDVAKYIGYVPQNHIPPFPFSVLDVVTMGRAAHINNLSSPTKLDTEIALEALEMLNISHLKDKIYTELSGGERQLVLIARALTQKPQILVMDEPTSNLDYGNQIKVLKHIENLVKDGLAVIMSSHFPNHALYYASKVALMKDGQIIASGKPDEVITGNNLKKIYDVNVEVVNVTNEEQKEFKICLPVH